MEPTSSWCVSHVATCCRLKLFRGPDQVDPYQGARDLESLVQFVMDKVAGGVEEGGQEGEGGEVKREAEQEAGEEQEPGVVEKDDHGLLHLTDATFSSFIDTKDGVQFVKFYAPWSV